MPQDAWRIRKRVYEFLVLFAYSAHCHKHDKWIIGILTDKTNLIKTVRAFLCFARYYRKFIEDYARIAFASLNSVHSQFWPDCENYMIIIRKIQMFLQCPCQRFMMTSAIQHYNNLYRHAFVSKSIVCRAIDWGLVLVIQCESMFGAVLSVPARFRTDSGTNLIK